MSNLKKEIDKIYSEGNYKSFFVFPFFEILYKNYDKDKYVWMNSRLKKEFNEIVNNDNKLKVFNDVIIEEEYKILYNDSFQNHGNNFNSSHAISQRITRNLKWLQDFVEFGSYLKKVSVDSNSKRAKKPIYKIKNDKLNEIKKLISNKSKYKLNIYSLIQKHR